MDEELWRPLESFPLYAVSSYGRIVNSETGHVLKPYKPGRFYPSRVILRRDGFSYSKLIHRLVAETFFTGYSDKQQVYHRDGDFDNNHILNLRIRGAGGLGQLRPGSIALRVRWLMCNETDQRYRNINEAAIDLNVSPGMIYDMLRGKQKSVRGFTFEWVYETGKPYVD